MCSVSVQNIIDKCTIKCLREKSGLLSFALHLTTPPPPPKTSDCKADHSSINQSESVELLKGKSDRKSFQGQTAAEPLANKQETW